MSLDMRREERLTGETGQIGVWARAPFSLETRVAHAAPLHLVGWARKYLWVFYSWGFN